MCGRTNTATDDGSDAPSSVCAAVVVDSRSLRGNPRKWSFLIRLNICSDKAISFAESLEGVSAAIVSNNSGLQESSCLVCFSTFNMAVVSNHLHSFSVLPCPSSRPSVLLHSLHNTSFLFHFHPCGVTNMFGRLNCTTFAVFKKYICSRTQKPCYVFFTWSFYLSL